jgi:hypothetical protein
VLYSAAQFDFVKEKIAQNQEPWKSAYDLLIGDANAWLNEEPSPMAHWNVPTYYSNEEAHKAATRAMLYDLKSAYACALAYQFTENAAYADQAAEVLSAWANVTVTIGGSDSVLVAATVGGGFALTAEFLQDYPAWRDGGKAVFDTWLNDVYLSFVNKDYYNNWGDWTLFARLASKAYLGLDLSDDAAKVKEDIASKINAEGFMSGEIGREANGMWYSYFALAPMTASCQIIYHATGENLFAYTAPNGRNIKAALDKFLYYCVNRGSVAWPHYGTVNYPNPLGGHSWPLPLYEAMAGVYGDTAYADFVAAYRPLSGPYNSGDYHHIAWFYPTLMYNSLNLFETL